VTLLIPRTAGHCRFYRKPVSTALRLRIVNESPLAPPPIGIARERRQLQPRSCFAGAHPDTTDSKISLGWAGWPRPARRERWERWYCRDPPRAKKS